jgi:hypothetical protein
MARLYRSYFVRMLISFMTVVFAQLMLLEIVYGLISLFAPDSQGLRLLPVNQVGLMYIILFAGKINVINLVFVLVWSILFIVIVFLRISSDRESSSNLLFLNRLLWPVVGVVTFIQLPFSQSFTPVIASVCFVALVRYLPLPIGSLPK